MKRLEITPRFNHNHPVRHITYPPRDRVMVIKEPANESNFMRNRNLLLQPDDDIDEIKELENKLRYEGTIHIHIVKSNLLRKEGLSDFKSII